MMFVYQNQCPPAPCFDAIMEESRNFSGIIPIIAAEVHHIHQIIIVTVSPHVRITYTLTIIQFM